MTARWLCVVLLGVACDSDPRVDCLSSEPVPLLDHDQNRCVQTGTQFGCEQCQRGGPPCEVVEDDVFHHGFTVCGLACDSLAEASCLTSPGCRVVYVDDAFQHCRRAEFGAASSAACGELDVDACADRDDCIAFYVISASGQSFERCGDEPGASVLP